MKKFAAVVTVLVLCLTVSSCQLVTTSKKISPEEVVNTFMNAFLQGDYEGIKPYISADNPLHLFFAGIDESTGGEMSPAYQALCEKLKTVTYTAAAVEGEETWGAVEVTLTVPDYSEAIYTSMTDALSDEINNGTDAFYRMPDWMLSAVNKDADTVSETVKVYVGNRDGGEVMDTNTNREFFEMLCGGLKPYLEASITTCTFPDGFVWEILSQGDEIIAMINTETVENDGSYTTEDMEAMIPLFIESYSEIDGITANAVMKDGALIAKYGVDMQSASSYTLEKMGIISDRITAGSMGWLSLSSTISGFESEGAECVTEYFKTMEQKEEE